MKFFYLQKLEHKQSKLRQQNSLQLNTVPTPSPAPTLTRSDSIHSVSTARSTISSPPPVSSQQQTAASSVSSTSGKFNVYYRFYLFAG